MARSFVLTGAVLLASGALFSAFVPAPRGSPAVSAPSVAGTTAALSAASLVAPQAAYADEGAVTSASFWHRFVTYFAEPCNASWFLACLLGPGGVRSSNRSCPLTSCSCGPIVERYGVNHTLGTTYRASLLSGNTPCSRWCLR